MADSSKDPSSPASTSSEYDAMLPSWELVNTLLGGTPAMRAAGEKYCPRYQEETDKGYRARLQGAVLLNRFQDILDNLSGKPFSEEVKLNDDIPPAIRDSVLGDVDLQGNKLGVFLRQWFREGMAKAFCHVLIDMPKPEPLPEGEVRTLEHDRREGIRPYWVLINPENVLFARMEMVEGVETLKHVRIAETYTEQQGFIEITKPRIRVLEPGHVELWEPDPTQKKKGKEVWVKKEEWDTGLDAIPLVTFYAHRECFMVGKPPLMDLAWLNVTHWQSTSDQRHILNVARFPILACSGASKDDSDPIVVGPNKVLYNNDPQGKFYYVEHTGAAIAAGRTDLKDLEEQMSNHHAQFLRSRPGSTTATSRALDSAESSHDLAALTLIFEDAVAQALYFTAEWMKLPLQNDSAGTVELVKDYQMPGEDAADLTALQAARQGRDISRQTYLDGLKLRGVLPEDFDAEADAAKLADEADQSLGRSILDLNPGARDNPPPASGGNNPLPDPGTKPPPSEEPPPIPAQK